MKIAVIGAGLCGSSLAWHLINQDPSLSITLFDPFDPKERTSSLANLLYPYIGMKSKLSWKGDLSFQMAKEMLQKIQNQSKHSFYSKRGLLKMPSNSTQLSDFEKAASDYGDLKMILDPFFKKPALWVEEALQVDCDLYLQALMCSCIEKGVKYVKALFEKTDRDHFDLILHASGEKAKALFKPNKTSYLKGQALIIQGNPLHLEYPIIFDGLHLIPSLDQKTLYVGNTFERKFESSNPCREKAIELLWEKLIKLCPEISQNDILEVKAGVRLTYADRLPKIGKLDAKEYLFTAVGSKGLLYHSFLAHLLSKHILEGEPIPKQVLFNRDDRAY